MGRGGIVYFVFGIGVLVCVFMRIRLLVSVETLVS